MSKHNSLTVEQKFAIVIEGLRGETSISEVCRKNNLGQSQYYKLRDRFLEAGKAGFGVRQDYGDIGLKNKIAELERIIGKLTIQNEILKKNDELMGTI